MLRTVVDLDLVEYSTVARILEQSTGAKAVAMLDAQIQRFVDVALAQVGLSREQSVIRSTGDGALLLFEEAADAHRFAEAVHSVTSRHNADLTEPSAKRWFRMGAATGDVSLPLRTDPESEVAGLTIVNAVRLEAASRPGELLVDHGTYQRLPATLQLRYSPEERVAGKRKEILRVRRCVMAQEACRAHTLSTVVAASQPASAERSLSGAGEDDVTVETNHHSDKCPASVPPARALRALPDKPSIAVLPFTNLDADASYEYFSDGIAADIITELSRFSDLFVIARNSSFQYRGKAEAAEVLRIDPNYKIAGRQNRIKIRKRSEDSEHLAEGLRKAGLPEK